MLTLKKINNEIAKLGGNEILVKGEGYYYFAEGEAYGWYNQSVYVYRLNQLTLEQWIQEYLDRKNSQGE